MDFMPTAPTCLPAQKITRALNKALPRGSCDCHAHVFGPEERFAYSSDRDYTPPVATVQSYLAVLDALGIDRAVLVQPSVYRFDNNCLIDALATCPQRLRGVVVVDETVAAEELHAMSRHGVCGIRVNAAASSFNTEYFFRMARIAKSVGWHIDLQVRNIEQVYELSNTLKACEVPVVIEAMGKVRASHKASERGFVALRQLLSDEIVWVKLSHVYKLSEAGSPYVDLTWIVRELAAANASRLVWGSDWPHPMTAPMPQDEDLAELPFEWFPERDLLEAVLVQNPERLYGFAPISSS